MPWIVWFPGNLTSTGQRTEEYSHQISDQKCWWSNTLMIQHSDQVLSLIAVSWCRFHILVKFKFYSLIGRNCMVKDILISLKQVNERRQVMSKKIGIKLVVFLLGTCWLLHRIARLVNLERKFLRITLHYSYNNDYCQDNCVRPKLLMSGQCCFNPFLL